MQTPSRTLRLFGRTALLMLEGLAILAVLLVLSGGALFWYLARGPVDIAFAREYVQDALSDADSGREVQLDRVVLDWQNPAAPPILSAHGLRLLTKDGTEILDISEAAITLSRSNLLVGAIVPRRIVLKNPVLRLVRTEDNHLTLGFSAETQDSAGPGRTELMEFLERFSLPDPARRGNTPYRGLKSFEIQGAKMVVEDHVLGISWFVPVIDIAFRRRHEGLLLATGLRLPSSTRAEGQYDLQAEAQFVRDSKEVRLSLEFDDLNPDFLLQKTRFIDWDTRSDVVLDGKVTAILADEEMTLRQASFDLSTDSSVIRMDDLFPRPLTIENLAIAARYDGATGSEPARLTLDRIALNEGPLRIDASGAFTLGAADGQGRLELSIPDAPVDHLETLWPLPLHEEGLKEWLVDKMKQGAIHDLSAGLDVLMHRDATGAWDFTTANERAAFAFEGVTIDYRAPLPPAVNASGKGLYENDTLAITDASATIADMKADAISVTVDQVSKAGAGTVDIKAGLTGPLGTMFDYIGREPINLGKKLGMKPSEVRGDAALNLHIDFPALKHLPADMVRVRIEGTVDNAHLPRVVEGQTLEGGPLTLKVAGGTVNVAGTGTLSGHPVTFDWTRHVDPAGKPFVSKVAATVKTDDALRRAFGADLSDFVRGMASTSLTYTELSPTAAEVEVDADLTESTLALDWVNYEKPPGQKASARASVRLENGKAKEIRDLTVTGPSLKLEKGRLQFAPGKDKNYIAHGRLPRIIAGESDVSVEIDRKSESAPQQFAVNGRVLDVTAILAGKDPTETESAADEGHPTIVSVSVDRMRTSGKGSIDKARVLVDSDEKGLLNRLRVDARAGKGELYIRYEPDASGRRMFRMESNDAGAALRAFGVHETVQGGTLVVVGAPIPGGAKNDMTGTLNIFDFTVTDAPVLAKLLGALSLNGILELLDNQGVSFERLEAGYDWIERDQEKIIKFRDGRTTGSALGLTFEGAVDRQSDQADISGTIVPISGVNRFIGSIPVLGNLITGSEGGAIFAATYRLKGPVTNLDTSVNPLAVLAPGFLRKLFFESGTDPDTVSERFKRHNTAPPRQ